MRLYHVPNSSSQRCVWLLEESGEPFELVILGDRASRLADPEHVARHPMGRVPVLEDNGSTIFESGAICLYIGDKYPGSGLLPPPGTGERGEVYQWAFFSYTELQARIIQVWTSADEARDTATAGLREAFDAVAASLGEREYLVGGQFTVADLLVGSALSFAQRLEGVELPASLSSYVDALEARPARQRALARNPSEHRP
jgi:glutathione S-transferase